jgi:hypothetical protein
MEKGLTNSRKQSKMEDENGVREVEAGPRRRGKGEGSSGGENDQKASTHAHSPSKAGAQVGRRHMSKAHSYQWLE